MFVMRPSSFQSSLWVSCIIVLFFSCYRDVTAFSFEQVHHDRRRLLSSRRSDDARLLLLHKYKYVSAPITLRRREEGICKASRTTNDSSSNYSNAQQQFSIRKASSSDLGQAAKILTDSFYKSSTNFFTYPIERFNQYSILESTFQTFQFSERSSGEEPLRHVMCVATIRRSDNNNPQKQEEQVIGYCEVDDYVQKNERNPAPRPYMYNLAVDSEFRRMGVASALVDYCEQVVQREWNHTVLYCRTKQEENDADKALYRHREYTFESKHVRSDDGVINLTLKKTLVDDNCRGNGE